MVDHFFTAVHPKKFATELVVVLERKENELTDDLEE